MKCSKYHWLRPKGKVHAIITEIVNTNIKKIISRLWVHGVRATSKDALLGSKKPWLLTKAISYWVLYTEKWQICISEDIVPIETIIQPICAHTLKNMFMQGRYGFFGNHNFDFTDFSVC